MASPPSSGDRRVKLVRVGVSPKGVKVETIPLSYSLLELVYSIPKLYASSGLSKYVTAPGYN